MLHHWCNIKRVLCEESGPAARYRGRETSGEVNVANKLLDPPSPQSHKAPPPSALHLRNCRGDAVLVGQ